ncbi:hypothetical protein N7492_001428 [Penicillium capsulatum]|uniref:Phosphatidylinositol-specific phospholipase C X domain-containing protein n=1 Tax=Penicillium capsulatum TaxID=69766 RepID=A0A9W9ITN1_9EURO|nr:hypothetical protein N7492_001428 [Penicillium capsulatum]KAJ6129515.1 hypothetical protein N7512_002295 [Penicillium capsulatum]
MRGAGIILPVLATCSVASASDLQDASPIFGDYVKKTGGTAEWMKKHPDSTLLVHMNIPGAHDSASWNYTQANQDAFRPLTDRNGMKPAEPESLRCQEQPFITMLNAGIRAFDLRYASDPDNKHLFFYHTSALLSDTATVDNVLQGFYQWLDDHPSETIFLSLLHESETAKNPVNDETSQRHLYNVLTSEQARRYFVQAKELGTLGESRGKMTLLRRFSLDQLPASDVNTLPGLYFPLDRWPDNGAEFELTYNDTNKLTAYIGDYYHPETPAGSSVAENVKWKYDATTENLKRAVDEHPDSLFWTWASGVNGGNQPPIWPRTLALGDGDGGVNHQLVPFFEGQKGKRLGIVMFDYFDQPTDLLETFLGV